MRYNSSSVAILVIASVGFLCSVETVRAQGCIVARSSEPFAGPESQGGYLSPGEFNVTIGYRHQFSFRHFVGSAEQTYRIQQGTEVMNKINLENLNITYQATPRFSFSADIPVLFASRRGNNSAYTTTSQGIGDTIVSAQGWVFNPQENTRGNVSFGFGMMLPTGKDNVMNRVDAFNGLGPQNVTLDYSIQPGSGGYGLLFDWQAYKNLGSSQLYFNGSYIATPQNTNNVLRSATAASNPLTAYNSISDQYLLEAGVARSIQKVRGLTVTFGPRFEGVPADDLIGDSLGFRRPGFALSLEPGIQYAWGTNLITASIGKAVYRDRTRSVPDRMTGGHGDAAFADYVWLASYSFRFGRPKGHTEHMGLVSHPTSTAKAELKLTDVDGKHVRLADYRGQAVVLTFWATWCGPCKEEMPLLAEAQRRYKARGVVFLGASLDDSTTRPQVPEFVTRHQVDFPVLVGATAHDLARMGLGDAVPATAFIDRNGNIVARVPGEIHKEQLEADIDQLLGSI